MIQTKKSSLIVLIVSAMFLLASTSVFAGDYQTQNKIDDKDDMENSSQQSQKTPSSSSKQGDGNMSGQNSPQNRDSSTSPSNSSGMDKGDPSQEENKRNY